MGAALQKIVICVALGYDSYLIMRHGMCTEEEENASPLRLGCYFCNDIQAPTETTAHLALDQQCTVARPGLAPIASALAVELLVSLLHHPSSAFAAHGLPDENRGAEMASSSVTAGALGGVPHMIKGSVFHFSMTCAHGPAFYQCTACSEAVKAAYLQDRWPFVLSAITVTPFYCPIGSWTVFSVQNDTFLQDLTGLTELLEKAEALIEAAASDADSEYEVL